jgi:hypothetical protein
MIQFRDGELRYVRVAYKDGQISRLGVGGTSDSLGKFEVKKDELLLDDATGKTHKFTRLAKDPPDLTPKPVSIAEAKELDREKVKEVQKELARREGVGAKLRQEFHEAIKDDDKRPAKIKAMIEADADDTRFLVGLVKEIGWIDSGRFGYKAQESAVIILMHSADPALKEAALPILKKEVLARRFDAETYAGLYDRYCFHVGLPDRYGMHLSPDAKGLLVVGPLEDRARVDEFRKEISLPPLAKYLERRREENGGKDIRILD